MNNPTPAEIIATLILLCLCGALAMSIAKDVQIKYSQVSHDRP